MAQIAFAAVSAFGSYRQGQGEAAYREAQAKQSEMEAEKNYVAAKQEGNQALRRLRMAVSATIASAAAGGIDAASGSPSALNLYNYKEGASDYYESLHNATVGSGMARYQSQIYRSAGKTAKQTGLFNAAGHLGMGYLRHKTV